MYLHAIASRHTNQARARGTRGCDAATYHIGVADLKQMLDGGLYSGKCIPLRMALQRLGHTWRLHEPWDKLSRVTEFHASTKDCGQP